ncbi:MAG TPA: hypothetical protein VFT74_20195 [Isosphaeraceae bacterium]|nr:hypothetical protein [Isosphaeraceae bacterium]
MVDISRPSVPKKWKIARKPDARARRLKLMQLEQLALMPTPGAQETDETMFDREVQPHEPQRRADPLL